MGSVENVDPPEGEDWSDVFESVTIETGEPSALTDQELTEIRELLVDEGQGTGLRAAVANVDRIKARLDNDGTHDD